MASHRISFRQLNGEAIVLDIIPDITGQELKERIKKCQLWDDELTRQTTRVDIVVGASRVMKNDETAADAGLSPESDVPVVLKQNAVTCSQKGEIDRFGHDIDLESLLVVYIPSGATEIYPLAFENYKKMASVTIPDAVTLIGSRAFGSCSSLASVTIPNSVTRIGYGAFAGCSSLESVTIPDSVTQIESRAFESCRSLSCSSLASVTIPNSVTYIGVRAFFGCSSLEHVTIPNSVTKICDGAFAGCSSLASVTIPDSVTQIGLVAFKKCEALASVTIPNSVTKIGERAFQGCSALTLVVPVTRTWWEFGAFMGCKQIRAKECECQECEYEWFLQGEYECPRRRS
ncbi:unnamed protein product [Durusdinium trenchii]|uniref:Ubiquitin-like domain-containing protein n=1 Tax=Durusdinium trenchii TaxID=1381693 RepID=A0ABP0I147_9DINO